MVETPVIVRYLSQARAELCPLFKAVIQQNKTIKIISRGHVAVLIPISEYQSLKNMQREWWNLANVINLLPPDEDDQV